MHSAGHGLATIVSASETTEKQLGLNLASSQANIQRSRTLVVMGGKREQRARANHSMAHSERIP